MYNYTSPEYGQYTFHFQVIIITLTIVIIFPLCCNSDQVLQKLIHQMKDSNGVLEG